jgi:hypothetical protein
MIQSHNNSCFQLTFSNGYTISVLFGPGSLSSNRNSNREYHETRSPNAEVAVWHGDGDFLAFGEDDQSATLSWVTADQLAEVIQLVSTARDDSSLIRQVRDIVATVHDEKAED